MAATVAVPRQTDLQNLDRKINERSYDLFKERSGQAPLRVTRIIRRRVKDDDGEDREEVLVIKNEDVVDIPQISKIREESSNPIQLFYIGQQRSWTTLDISRETFDAFMGTYDVFQNFLKCVLTYGRKSEENEFEFPGFSVRRTRDSLSPGSHIYEMAYVLRRVELNGRGGQDGECPWSIRQTAVHHKLSTVFCEMDSEPVAEASCRSTFLLITASDKARLQFENCLDRVTPGRLARLSSWNTHRILIIDALGGWADYMAYLGHKLKEQTDRVVLATVGKPVGRMASVLDFKINFEDRQELKLVEDQVLDLQVILPGILDAVSGVKKTCERFLSSLSSHLPEDEKLEVEEIVDELDEYCKEAKILTERAKILTDRAMSGARMVSDLLNYEGTNALKNLAMEQQAESKVMSTLAEKSTKDAAAVKTLTVITLLYLPFSIVVNFFSTEFVQTNDQGHMQVTSNVWILAAISIPLTLITISIWWGWVYLVKGRSKSGRSSSWSDLRGPASIPGRSSSC